MHFPSGISNGTSRSGRFLISAITRNLVRRLAGAAAEVIDGADEDADSADRVSGGPGFSGRFGGPGFGPGPEGFPPGSERPGDAPESTPQSKPFKPRPESENPAEPKSEPKPASQNEADYRRIGAK